MIKNISRLYESLQHPQIDNPFDELFLIMDILTKEMFFHSDNNFSKNDGRILKNIARKRAAGMPLEYIFGKAVFMGLLLYCSRETLIPRKETELLVKIALQKINKLQDKNQKTLRIIDLGTGCGNIAVSLAVYSRKTKIFATDISAEATGVALSNVQRYGLEKRVFVHCGDLLKPFESLNLDRKIDMIVCNPPYLPSTTVKKLPSVIRDYEPIVALDAGPYGVNIFMRFIHDALNYLKPGAFLIFEIGAGQDKLVTRLLEKNGGYEQIEYFYDGPEIRVISARKKVKR